MITKTGDGLSILIKCEYLPHHNWMAFASWYSILKNLPDAKVMIHCQKNKIPTEHPLFCWPGKVEVPFSYNLKKFENINKEITCDYMAINTWNEDALFGEAKSNDLCTFCSYANGCGDFVISKWINKLFPPFKEIDSFSKGVAFINERKILELWRKVLPVYLATW